MIQLPEGITLQMLEEKFKEADKEYTKAMKKARILDAVDRGRLWEAVDAKFPTYQILPDKNHVAYVKNNLLASLYSVGKRPDLRPTSEQDKNLIQQLNIALEYAWDNSDVSFHQMEAGERAALLNYGVTHVGWDAQKTGGSKNGDTWFKGDVRLKNINPMKFRRDPYADSIEESDFACYWNVYHKSILESDTRYQAEFEEFINSGGDTEGIRTQEIKLDVDKENPSKKDYYKVFVVWFRFEGQVHEVHTINFKHTLYLITDIKPSNEIPIAELYCNLPAGDLMGTSEPSKIFASSLATNMLTSIAMTTELKNSRPPKFITAQSGLNINAFKKHGNDADHTFVVNGDASKAVHYHQYPQTSAALPSLVQSTEDAIKNLSGIDDRYTGRDTGSIITTGGTEAMLDQVTLIDQPKVNNYVKYSKRLGKLIIANLINFANPRRYFIQKDSQDAEMQEYETIEVAFPEIDPDTVFSYNLDISSELPKNKARLAQMANVLMEKQMQYASEGQQVEWITPEEWLMLQDLPIKEYMSERMGIQRSADYVEQVAKIVTNYANLTDEGLPSDQALLQTAQMLQGEMQPQQASPLPTPMPEVVDNEPPMV